jgi:hypothetical protein
MESWCEANKMLRREDAARQRGEGAVRALSATRWRCDVVIFRRIGAMPAVVWCHCLHGESWCEANKCCSVMLRQDVVGTGNIRVSFHDKMKSECAHAVVWYHRCRGRRCEANHYRVMPLSLEKLVWSQWRYCDAILKWKSKCEAVTRWSAWSRWFGLGDIVDMTRLRGRLLGVILSM